MYERHYEAQVQEGEPFPVPLPAAAERAPFEEYLGLTIEECTRVKTVLAMPFKVKLAQAKGFLHGGAIASLAHSALAVAIKARLPDQNDIEILAMSLRFLNPVRGGVVRAVATIAEMNDRDIQGEVTVYNDKGEKAATLTAAYRKNRA